MDSLAQEVSRRRTFAIISHPDAGKTTITEKLLLIAAVLQRAGEVRGRGATGAYARSDWMAMEKERGISVTTSVMQFPYRSCIINLLDTPGHEDFSEDTYRVLTAVDAVLMVIDAAKGVEERTRKLMDVARLRATPVLTFMNKLDRDSRDPLELIDEVEKELGLRCTPVTWPIGSGKEFKGVCHRQERQVYLYRSGEGHHLQEHRTISLQDHAALSAALGEERSAQLADELELLEAGTPPFAQDAFCRGELTPVFFGTALGNFGVDLMLEGLTAWAPPPQARQADTRPVEAQEAQFSGFIFKIQANMDPRHRDRIAFLRIVSGCYQRGMQLYHVRARRQIQVSDAVTFMAESREMAAAAVAGDIIGLYNHGTIRIGDTFTLGEELHFSGIPDFAPELFRRIRLRDPLRQKQLLKGLLQLSEEGAVQVFRPLQSNDLIVGAVGMLQFDVVVSRLRHEYAVEALYEPVAVATARWVSSSDEQALEELRRRVPQALATDGGGHLAYLASSTVNLNLTMERYPQVTFNAAREH